MSRRASFYLLIAVFVWLGGLHAAGDSTAVVVRPAEIKAGPSFGARTAGRAAAGRRVELGTRLGGWQKVTLLPGRDIEGWLRVYQVRTDIAEVDVVTQKRTTDDDGALSGLAALSRRGTTLFGRREMDRTHDGGMTAAIGIRGLTEADLENARPDTGELKRLKGYAAGAAAAEHHAEQHGLKKQSVEPLPAGRDDG